MGDGIDSKKKPVSWAIPEDLVACVNMKAQGIPKMNAQLFVARCIEVNTRDVLPVYLALKKSGKNWKASEVKSKNEK